MNVDNQAGDGEQGNSLREDLEEAYRAAEERESAEAAPSVEDNSGEANAVASQDGASDETQTRADGRDANGRFAAKPKEGEAAPADAAAAAGGQADPAPQDGDEAPASFRAAAKAAWAQTPAEVRAEIHRREREAADLAGRMDGERRFGREFAEIVRPHMETIQGFGITPQFAVQTLLNNDRIMRTGTIEQKVQLGYRMLQEYGLNPAAFAQPQPGVSQDPHVQRLEQEIAQLRRQATSPQQQTVAPLPQAEPDAMQTEIEAFRSDPAHPHFDAVLPVMTALLESGAAPDLQSAYDQAVWSNPTLRSTLQPATPAPQVAQRQSQATKTAAARRADVSVSASPGAAGDARPTSLRDELSQQLRQHGFV